MSLRILYVGAGRGVANWGLAKLATVATLASWCFACGPAEPPKNATGGEAEKAHALTAEQRRDALRNEFAKAPESARRQCEIAAGDCRLDVNEARDALLAEHTLLECRNSADRGAEVDCVAKTLEARGDYEGPIRYYERESWCLDRLVACTVSARQDALAASERARNRARQDKIETSAPALDARAAAASRAEGVEYLKSVLPPQAGESCEPGAPFESCQGAVEKLQREYEQHLTRDDQSFDERAALRAYVRAQSASAECYGPTLACLTTRLDGFGGTAETRKLLTETLKTLKRRELLAQQADTPTRETCITRGQARHQSKIIDDYKRFAREPVLFFQAQLHRDFRVMYDSQTSCLESTGLKPPVAMAQGSEGAR